MGGTASGRLAVVVLIAALAAAACEGPPTGPGATPSPGPGGREPSAVEGGTVIFATEQQPTTLNGALRRGDTFVNRVISSAVLSPLWRITPDLQYEPWLLAGEPEVTADPFSVTYTLREGLVWSDGEPLTARDVAFTHDTIVNRRFGIASRAGHELVRSRKVLDDRRVRFVFRRPFAAWRTLFSAPGSAILPRHVLKGEDFDTIWNDEITVSSGPLEFDTWQRGQEVVLKRNENYWGPPAPLDEVIIAFEYRDLDSQIAALEAGAVDVLHPQAQRELRQRLEGIEGVNLEVDLRPGAFWEYVDLNTTTPPLDKLYVRQAIAKAIDRSQLVAETLAPLAADTGPLSNVLWHAGDRLARDNWSQPLAYDPAAAEGLLVRNGCTRPGRTYRCDGELLELEYASTSDTDLRTQHYLRIRDDLAAIGISLKPKFDTAAAVLKPSFLSSRSAWDMLGAARGGSPDFLAVQAPWRCDSPAAVNTTKYCNPAVDALLEEAGRTLDQAEHARLRNQADALIAQDVPTIPLYQQPDVLVWHSAIQGPQNNASAWGPLWNVGEWALSQ